MKKIEEILKEFGLSDRETAIYLNLLPLGKVSAAAAGQRCRVVRTTSKYICDELARKGLIERIVQKNKVLYRAFPPQKLVHIVNEKQQEIDKKKHDISMIMGILKSMHQPGMKLPKVQYYTNISDLKLLARKILADAENEGEYVSFSNFHTRDDLSKKMRKIMDDFIVQRMKKNIFLRMIIPDNDWGKHVKKIDKKEERNRETRISEANLFFLTGEIALTRESLYAFSLENNSFFGFSLKSKRIVEMFRAMFELAWMSARK